MVTMTNDNIYYGHGLCPVRIKYNRFESRPVHFDFANETAYGDMGTMYIIYLFS